MSTESSKYLWKYPFEGNSITPPLVVSGTDAILCLAVSTGGTGLTGTVQRVNFKNKTVVWSTDVGQTIGFAPAVTQGTPVISGGVIYVPANDYLYALDLKSGDVLWSLFLGAGGGAVSSPSAPLGDVIYVPMNSPGNEAISIFAVNVQTQKILWQSSPAFWNSGQASFQPLIVGSNVILGQGAMSGVLPWGMINCFDAGSGDLVWQSIPEGNAPICTNFVLADDLPNGQTLIFCGMSDGTVRAFDIGNGGAQFWSYQTAGSVVGPPAYANGMVYFGSSDERFYAYPAQPQAGDSATIVPIGSPITTGVLTASGSAFFAATSVSGGNFYTVDTSDLSASPLVAATGELVFFQPAITDETIAFLPGSFDGGGTMQVISLSLLTAASEDEAAVPAMPAGLPGMYRISSQLLVDDYTVSGTTATPTNPTFQSILTLLDTNGYPDPTANAHIWAQEAVTLTINGTQYSVGTDEKGAVVVPVDALAQIQIVAPGSIGTPNLFIRPSGFPAEFSFAVLPDHANINTLATVQGSQLLAATGYDGTSILKSEYQTSTYADQIAQMIQNTIGLNANSGGNTASSVIFSGTYAATPWQPGSTPSWQVTMGKGQFSFTPVSSEDADRLTAGFTMPSPDSFGSALKKFFEDIVHGIYEIGEILWKWTESGVAVVVHDIVGDKVWNFIVTTIDDAVQALTAFLSDVATNLDAVIQWLSYLFDWDDILATHNMIVAQVNSSATQFVGALGSLISDVDTFFQNAETNVTTFFQNMEQQLTGQTFQGLQQSYGNLSSVTTQSGSDTTVQMQWLLYKVRANAGGSSAAAMAFDDSLTTMIGDYFAGVGQTIQSSPQFESLPADLQSAVTSIADLFKKGKAGVTVDAFLNLISDVVVTLLQLANSAIDGFITLVQDALTLLLTALSTPIDIPWVSSFYQAISGNPLSLLDLFALLVAIPTTIIYKIITGTTPSDSEVAETSGQVNWVAIGYVVATIVMALVWVIADLTDLNSAITKGIAAASAVYYLLGFALMVAATQIDGSAAVLLLAQLVSVFIAFMTVNVSPTTPAWATFLPMVYCGYGFGLLAISGILAGVDPTDFLGSDGLVLISNILGSLPYLAQPLQSLGAPGKGALVVIDALGYFGSAVINATLYWDTEE